MRLRPASLQGRLLVAVLGLVAVVWVVAAGATWRDARHELDELLDGHLAQAAAVLVVQQLHEIEEGGAEHGLQAPSLHRYAPRVAFQVWHEGQLVMRSEIAPVAPMGPIGERQPQGFRTLEIDGTAWRVFAAYGSERDVRVFVGEQIQARRSILRAVLRSTLWPMMVALPVLALVAWWAVRHGLAPLREMGRVLAARRPDTWQPVVLHDTPREMQPMLEALNRLFARIGALLESERRFTADAAHELRTPLAALRTQAQVALGSTDDAERRHALKATLAGCDRATHLVEQLLTLSRLDANGTGGPTATPVAQAAVLRGVAADLAPAALAREQQMAVDIEPGPDVAVHGHAALLAVLVRNLVDNACRYSPAGASIELRLARDGRGAVLTVEDSGPGLSDADLQRLGERFFRVLGTEAPGSGLGWSIARRIAQVHGAQLLADRSPSLGGLRVRVVWPEVLAG